MDVSAIAVLWASVDTFLCCQVIRSKLFELADKARSCHCSSYLGVSTNQGPLSRPQMYGSSYKGTHQLIETANCPSVPSQAGVEQKKAKMLQTQTAPGPRRLIWQWLLQLSHGLKLPIRGLHKDHDIGYPYRRATRLYLRSFDHVSSGSGSFSFLDFEVCR